MASLAAERKRMYSKKRGRKTGHVLWMDHLAGVGQVREHGTELRHWVYLCNVEGSDSHYEFLVTDKNLLVEGELINFLVHESLGAVYVKKETL